MLEFNFAYGEIGYELCKNLRESVLGKEAFDGKEGESYHFVGYDKTEQIASARLTKLNDMQCEIKYVAVKKEYQRQLVGDLIMKALADKAESLGAKETVVFSPLELKPFFEFEGYKSCDNFTDSLKMIKDLTIKNGCGGCKK